MPIENLRSIAAELGNGVLCIRFTSIFFFDSGPAVASTLNPWGGGCWGLGWVIEEIWH